MSSKSLAVKYRPHTLDGVIGQDQAKKVLATIFRKAKKEEDIPGTLLITGDTGLGKTTLGRIVARTLNCAKGTSCKKCDSCKQFDMDSDAHPDFFEVNASDQRGIDDARGFKKLATYAPMYNVRVIMLDEAHGLTPQAKESLLKPLEKPPSQTLFIIATTNPEKLPRTIANRALKLHLTPIEINALAEHLAFIAKEEGLKIGKKMLLELAQTSSGMVRDAIATLEKMLTLIDTDGKVSKKDMEEAYDLIARDDTNTAAIRTLLGVYTEDTGEVLKGVSMTKDIMGLLSKMTWMNGYVMYGILKRKDGGTNSPYYPTAENKRLLAAALDSVNSKDVLARAVTLTGGLMRLQQQLLQPGVVDPTTCAIACLTMKE